MGMTVGYKQWSHKQRVMVLTDHPAVEQVEQIEAVVISEAESVGDVFKRIEVLEPHYTDNRNATSKMYYTEGEYKQMEQVGSEETVLVEDIYQQKEICDMNEISHISAAIAELKEELDVE